MKVGRPFKTLYTFAQLQIICMFVSVLEIITIQEFKKLEKNENVMNVA